MTQYAIDTSSTSTLALTIAFFTNDQKDCFSVVSISASSLCAFWARCSRSSFSFFSISIGVRSPSGGSGFSIVIAVAAKSISCWQNNLKKKKKWLDEKSFFKSIRAMDGRCSYADKINGKKGGREKKKNLVYKIRNQVCERTQHIPVRLMWERDEQPVNERIAKKKDSTLYFSVLYLLKSKKSFCMVSAIPAWVNRTVTVVCRLYLLCWRSWLLLCLLRHFLFLFKKKIFWTK